MRLLLLALLLMAPFAANAEESSTGPLFMKDLVDEGDFFETWASDSIFSRWTRTMTSKR